MNAHRLDLVSMIAGVVFVVVGMGHLLGLDVVSGWSTLLRAWPILLVAGGVAVLIGILRSASNA
jgi:hypothetical protein